LPSKVGIVQAKDLLNAYIAGDEPNVKDFLRKAPIIPDSLDARDVVAILKESPVHIGLVVDEFGHFEGIVTTADILESIVGSFLTEEGPSEQAFVRRTDGSLLIAGWMPVDEFSELTRISIPEDRDYHTVAGFVLKRVGALPAVGDTFTAHGWRFEILDLDGRRIDKILATRMSGTRRAVRA
jgi:putative hemolysin